jgi:hypothetical protein
MSRPAHTDVEPDRVYVTLRLYGTTPGCRRAGQTGGRAEGQYLARAICSSRKITRRGELYMKSLDSQNGPITFVWGALCPTTNGEPKLLERIINAMRSEYLPL